MRKLLFGIIATLFLFSCSNLKQVPKTDSIPSLKLVSSIEIPYNQNYKNTKIGGLSGIDYDAKQDLCYLISDDRATVNDARFYTAKIHLSQNKIDSVEFKNVVFLKNKAGEKYSNWNTKPSASIDPEDIRFNPKNNTLIWSSEGARVVKSDLTLLQNPAIQSTDLNGNYYGELDLPGNLAMQKEEKGPRSNGTLEGITFGKKHKTIYANIEEPLYEDDSEASTSKGAFIRLYQFEEKTRKNTAQYAYQIDPIAHEPNPKEAFAVNGISAIQYYDEDQLLVVERSYSTGSPACTVKVYLCDLQKATDVKNYTSLQNQKFEPASKKLLLNMDDLGIFIDNIEGLTFGPRLANGHRSLIFVSDNNFSDKQKTQVLVFEMAD